MWKMFIWAIESMCKIGGKTLTDEYEDNRPDSKLNLPREWPDVLKMLQEIENHHPEEGE